jgi:hypothetical protein
VNCDRDKLALGAMSERPGIEQAEPLLPLQAIDPGFRR